MKRYRIFQGMSWFLIVFDVLLVLIFFLPFSEHIVSKSAGLGIEWEQDYFNADLFGFVLYGFFFLPFLIFQLIPLGIEGRRVGAIIAMVFSCLLALLGFAFMMGSKTSNPLIGSYLFLLFPPILLIHLIQVEFKVEIKEILKRNFWKKNN